MKLYCKAFKTESFSNGNTKEWDKRNDYVDSLKKKYKDVDEGVTPLFRELLQLGYCTSVSKDRISLVEKVLKKEGYKVDKIEK